MADLRGLLQTFFGLRELEMNEAAAKLAQEQFGLQQQRAETERRATETAQLAQFQNVLGGLSDPTQIQPVVEEFAGMMGRTPNALMLLAGQTPSSVATQIAARSARGGASVSDAQVASRALTGMGVGEAAQDVAVSQIPHNELMQFARIAGGTAMGEAQKSQSELGWAALRETHRANLMGETLKRAEMEAMIGLKQAGMTDDSLKQLGNLVNERRQLIDTMLQKGATLTDEGKRSLNEAFNFYNSMIRMIAPQFPLTDIAGEPIAGQKGEKISDLDPQGPSLRNNTWADWIGAKLRGQ
jgi:hypothetical protein